MPPYQIDEASVGRDAAVRGYALRREALRRDARDSRRLRVYVIDPLLRFDSAAQTDVLCVPLEKLQPGPRGAIFEVDVKAANGPTYIPADLESTDCLLSDGYAPDPADSRFHGQMVYATAAYFCEHARLALGRFFSLRGRMRPDGSAPLVLKPFGAEEANACYDRRRGEIAFGYFKSRDRAGTEEKRFVFASMSSDIIIHETAHALVDALKGHYALPTNPQVLAFHEAFADLLAVFHRFSFPSFARRLIEESRFEFGTGLWCDFATEFGRAGREERALRTLGGNAYWRQGPSNAPHVLGQKLSGAVFEAFCSVLKRRSRKWVKLATGEQDLPPPGRAISEELLSELATRTTRVAAHFRAMCIRALDYCPPVDIEFGDYLRALMTADADLAPTDPWNYRGAVVEAFRRAAISPTDLQTFSETALLWRRPQSSLSRSPISAPTPWKRTATSPRRRRERSALRAPTPSDVASSTNASPITSTNSASRRRRTRSRPS